MAHLSAAADILVFPPARRLRYCQICRMMLKSQETKPLTLDGERSYSFLKSKMLRMVPERGRR
jgi:hypothetical protein